jgi:hypothetical protein
MFVARWQREYDEILSVRPGLTGWTQVAFVDEARILGREDPLTRYVEAILPQKVQLDRLYAAQPHAAGRRAHSGGDVPSGRPATADRRPPRHGRDDAAATADAPPGGAAGHHRGGGRGSAGRRRSVGGSGVTGRGRRRAGGELWSALDRRALAYIRLGDPRSAQLSLHVAAIERLCDARGLELVDMVVDVEGGLTVETAPPGLQWALGRLAAGAVRMLAVASAEHVTGAFAEAPQLARWFRERGVTLATADSAGGPDRETVREDVPEPAARGHQGAPAPSRGRPGRLGALCIRSTHAADVCPTADAALVVFLTQRLSIGKPAICRPARDSVDPYPSLARRRLAAVRADRFA